MMQNGPGAKKLRLAFLGVGWIGRNRMQAVLAQPGNEACAVCDPSAEMIDAALAVAPDAVRAGSLEELLGTRPDGVLIATPSALHAEQAIRALDSGVAVFCQKPLGINGTEVAAVVEAARRNDRLLGADFSYRHTEAMQLVRRLIREGSIGRVYAADLTFHNAYGPDKSWFYDAALSGGGCVMDLGVHLVDLLLWTLGSPALGAVRAELFARGRRLHGRADQVEDYAQATLEFETDQVARLTCSWHLHAGRDAVIGATFFGTEGALAFSNVAGSFYDFRAELRRGTSREVLVSPPDAWGGRAAGEWAHRLASDPGFNADAQDFTRVADILDRIYENNCAQSDVESAFGHPGQSNDIAFR
ncbi:Gfo/Idh/MocA family oxidoreductase [Mesorhizobium sp. SP-1A]|uniref:Gfo/Idh/MocA family protein n=1 Tax=Mesorhizobium sp. SP-1A TaxID=3077840 RepID=UPI0028F74EB2|nr:Gfo/Idh/MocA family oxidoreductase [Mesorhizobium sp. SP-1A]